MKHLLYAQTIQERLTEVLLALGSTIGQNFRLGVLHWVCSCFMRSEKLTLEK